MTKAKLNGWTRRIILGITVAAMVITFFVRAALVEERLDVMDTVHNTAMEAAKEAHDKDIRYIREDVAEIKEDVKKILEKLYQ